jgi:hypothetical protein
MWNIFNIFGATLCIWRPSPPSATRRRVVPWWNILTSGVGYWKSEGLMQLYNAAAGGGDRSGSHFYFEDRSRWHSWQFDKKFPDAAHTTMRKDASNYVTKRLHCENCWALAKSTVTEVSYRKLSLYTLFCLRTWGISLRRPDGILLPGHYCVPKIQCIVNLSWISWRMF